MIHDIIIGVDPGSGVSGLCLIKNNKISSASIEKNGDVVPKIKELISGDQATIVIEDVYPYSTQLKPQIISTCKFIGELSYRLSVEENLTVGFVPRNSVKKWIFDTFPDICLPRIDAKISYRHGWLESKGRRGLRTKSGDLRKASFQFVDDRIVIAAVKQYLGIPTPKPGKPNQYGLSGHSWQALAAALCYQNI